MKYLLVLLFLVSCIRDKPTPDINDYYIQVFGKSYICEEIDYNFGHHLIGCINVLDSKDIIKKIYLATNFIEVENLIGGVN
jgi:hypothetical protein